MLVALDLNDDESPVWNTMWLQYVPCETHIADLGHAWEDAKMKFEDFAKRKHDKTDVLSAATLMTLMLDMDEAKSKLLPYIAEWYAVRYGIGINQNEQ